MNPWNTWKGKLEAACFLLSKKLYRQCVRAPLPPKKLHVGKSFAIYDLINSYFQADEFEHKFE